MPCEALTSVHVLLLQLTSGLHPADIPFNIKSRKRMNIANM
jgi:hypothetical protein